MITADNITDEQIRELRKQESRDRANPNSERYDRANGLFGHGPVITACWDALNGHLPESLRRERRTYLAEILNARAASKDGAK